MNRKIFIFISGLAALGLIGIGRNAYALTISNFYLSTYNVSFENGGIPTGTTIYYQLDTQADVILTVCNVQNVGDTCTSTNQVYTQTYLGVAAGSQQSIYWPALWLIKNDLARHNGQFQTQISASVSGGTPVISTLPPSQLLTINSEDIHNESASESIDPSNGLTCPPYTILFSLSKTSQVTITITPTGSSGAPVRTLIKNVTYPGEGTNFTAATSSVTWDGLSDSGSPVPPGGYTATITAKDLSSADTATARTLSIAVQELATGSQSAQQLFENSVYVYPNPIRNGQATFHFQAIRDSANFKLRIYTLTGALVKDVSFGTVSIGTVVTYPWDLTNDGGKKVGRGLYFYEVRDNDSQGTLQIVKKLAVIQ
jgi:flagellar hook assembly protein FlgD